MSQRHLKAATQYPYDIEEQVSQSHISLTRYNLMSERKQRQLGQLEQLQPYRDAHNGAAKDNSKEQVAERQQQSPEDYPNKITDE